jgi:hypothetical protein
MNEQPEVKQGSQMSKMGEAVFELFFFSVDSRVKFLTRLQSPKHICFI